MINQTGNRYRLYFAVTDENGKAVYEFKDAHNLYGVYMYLPHENFDNYTVRIDEADYAYPVPFVKEGSMLKFKVQNSLLYSRTHNGTPKFTDIENHWGEEAIIKSARNLIVEGYGDGSYRPDGALTRAEFTTMLIRALYHNLSGEERVFAGPEKRNVYSDVKSSDWYRTNIGYADIAGLTGFITGNEFKPNQKITREEMAYMIAEAVKYIGINTSKAAEGALNYTDLNKINSGYLNGVKICTNLKLLQGSGGYFKPNDGLTRAEAATVLNRLLNLMGENI
jgi:hypothetical protein